MVFLPAPVLSHKPFRYCRDHFVQQAAAFCCKRFAAWREYLLEMRNAGKLSAKQYHNRIVVACRRFREQTIRQEHDRLSRWRAEAGGGAQ